MIVSKRLMKIAECIGHADCVADIGTDHAYLPIMLITQGRAEHVIAMDVRKQPLLRAEKNIKEAGVADRITLRLSDGAEKLSPGEASIITISGMGGALMSRIIAAEPEVFQAAKRLYLSPQSELFSFRSQLMALGYRIEDEWMVCEDGKYYFILLAGAGQETAAYEPCELHFGRQLLNKADGTLYEYLERTKRIQEQVLQMLADIHTENAKASMLEVRAYLSVIDEAMDRCNRNRGGNGNATYHSRHENV